MENHLEEDAIDVLNKILQIWDETQSSDAQILTMMTGIVASVAAHTKDPDLFLIHFRKIIDQALDDPIFDQEMTEYVNSINGRGAAD